MIVECNRCQTKLKMDPSKIGPSGVRVRCVKCQNVFKVPPATDVPSAPTAEETEKKAAPQPAVAPPPPPPPAPPPPVEENPFDQDLQAMPIAAPIESTPPPAASQPKKPEPLPEVPKVPIARPAGLKKTPPPAQSQLLSQPKIAVPMVAQPLLSENAPLKQRLIRSCILALLSVGGLVLGLLIIGVKPVPRDISLLLKYGARSLTPGLQVIRYTGKVAETAPGQYRLNVFGEIYNNSPESRMPPMLRLKVLSTEGEYLAQTAEKSGETNVTGFSVAPFSMELDVPGGPIGRYEVTIEK